MMTTTTNQVTSNDQVCVQAERAEICNLGIADSPALYTRLSSWSASQNRPEPKEMLGYPCGTHGIFLA